MRKVELRDPEGFPPGAKFIDRSEVIDNSEYNSDRKRRNKLRSIIQHLKDFYSQHFPDKNLVNKCPKFLNNKMKSGKIRHNPFTYKYDFVIVYVKDNNLYISPISSATYSIAGGRVIVCASVLKHLTNGIVKDEDILSIYHVSAPKSHDMEWVEWRRLASENILVENMVPFRSIEYYEKVNGIMNAIDNK